MLVLILATFTDYGVTWDEDVQNWYGEAVLNYYLTFFKDLSSLHYLDLFNYGAGFDMTAAALNRISPFGTYETRHLLNALIGLMGIVGTWKLGKALAGPRAGFFAALFLTLTPNYYGQMFNNPKDAPFAAGMAWSLYYLVRLLPGLPRPDMRLVAKLGLAAGLALAIRVGGLLILGYVGLALLLFVLMAARRDQEPQGRGRRFLDLFLAGAGAGGGGGLSGDAAVLALGATIALGQPGQGADLFLARDLPLPHAVRRILRAGERPALGISAHIYPARASRAGADPAGGGAGGGRMSP